MKAEIHIVLLKQFPIYQQLQLEEALLRTHKGNFCIINEGSDPAVVLGISSDPDLLVRQDANLPLIRRFSGGGTVVVDENTLFVSFICNKADFPFPCYPETLYAWSEPLYQKAFSHPLFALKEHDYVFGEKKCGGNAQYITKDRWVHHTTFLWDYTKERMDLLHLPHKRPLYRKDRDHGDFLCKLNEFYEKKEQVIHSFLTALEGDFIIKTADSSIWEALSIPHRQSVSIIERKNPAKKGPESR